MLPTTINEVIAALAEIIARSRQENSPMGYFAALYHRVTVRVQEGIARGEFQDGPRMERLDVIFANRYLEAYAHNTSAAKRPPKAGSAPLRPAMTIGPLCSSTCCWA